MEGLGSSGFVKGVGLASRIKKMDFRGGILNCLLGMAKCRTIKRYPMIFSFGLAPFSLFVRSSYQATANLMPVQRSPVPQFPSSQWITTWCRTYHQNHQDPVQCNSFHQDPDQQML